MTTARLELDDATLREWDARVLDVDDERRTALMRTHSGLHILSGVVFRDFGAYVTGSNMEPLSGRMDFNLPEVPEGFRDAVEEACNAAIVEDEPVRVFYLPREQAAGMPELSRSAESRVPEDVDDVRIVDIVGVDVHADGGTHVASTKAVGRVRVTKMESKGKGFRRVRIAIEQTG